MADIQAQEPVSRAQFRALQWFNVRADGADRFGRGDPPLNVVKALAERGFLSRHAQGGWGMTVFKITPAGVAAIARGPQS